MFVDVYIPAIDTTYDFELDDDVEVGKIIMEISEIIVKKMKESTLSNVEELILYDVSKEKKLEKQRNLYANGVRNGSKLLLV